MSDRPEDAAADLDQPSSGPRGARAAAPGNVVQTSKLDDLVENEARNGRQLGRFWYWLTAAMGIFMVLFYLYNAGVMPVAAQYHRGIYVLLTYVMVFLTYPFSKRSRRDRPTVADIALALVAIAAVGYWILAFENIK